MTRSGDNFIAGAWVAGSGASFKRHDPCDGKVTWEGHAASTQDINSAVMATPSGL